LDVAFQNLIQDVLGTIPGMNRGLAATRINEAYTKIQMENVWSFQNVTGGWLTPSLLGGPNAATNFLSPGTITVVPFTNTITADAVATAAWTANVPYPPLLTQQQIRIPTFSLYNIIALGNNGTVAYATVLTPGASQTPGTYVVPVLDPGIGAGGTVSITVNANGTVTLPPVLLTAGNNYTTPYITFAAGGTPATFSVTLIATITTDRLWVEPAQTNGQYCVYQAYYPVPANFRKWMDIRDTQNNEQMDWWSYTQIDLSVEDAQREIFDQPTCVVPYGTDTRPGSATYGQLLVELWPHPISQLSYTFQCQCNLPPLVNPNDTIAYPLSEELVRQRTYEMCCLWKEGSKGDDMERGSGANWQFLAKAYHEEYKDLLRQARIADRNLMELYFTKARMNGPFNGGGPDSYTGNQANVGW
jgi:hypothetical protein